MKWKVITIVLIFTLASSLAALEINSLADHVAAKMQYYDSDGLGIEPDSILIKVFRLSNNTMVFEGWYQPEDAAWITRVISGDSGEDTCILVNPTMDDIDGGTGISDYLVSYGAFNDALDDFAWTNITVQMQRTVFANIAQLANETTPATNMKNFFGSTGYNAIMSGIGYAGTVNALPPDLITSAVLAASAISEIQLGLSTFNPATSAVHLAGDSTQLIAQRLKWLLLYTGAEPNTIQRFYPFGGDPKDSTVTVNGSYKIVWYHNSSNPLIIDSMKIISQ